MPGYVRRAGQKLYKDLQHALRYVMLWCTFISCQSSGMRRKSFLWECHFQILVSWITSCFVIIFVNYVWVSVPEEKEKTLIGRNLLKGIVHPKLYIPSLLTHYFPSMYSLTDLEISQWWKNLLLTIYFLCQICASSFPEASFLILISEKCQRHRGKPPYQKVMFLVIFYFFLKNMQFNTLKFTDFTRCDKELYNSLQLFGAVKLHSLLSRCHWHFNCCLGNGINASHRWIATHLNVQPVCVGEN